jgi:hypothetical protein
MVALNTECDRLLRSFSAVAATRWLAAPWSMRAMTSSAAKCQAKVTAIIQGVHMQMEKCKQHETKYAFSAM